MRLEQPGVVAVGLAVLLGPRPHLVRPHWTVLLIPLAALIYLVILATSSLLLAPSPAKSMLLVAWTGISMLAGAIAFTLLLRDPGAGPRWLLIIGVLTAVAGLGTGLLFWLFGPDWRLAVHGASGPLPKVTAFVWEPNLYASVLAATVPFAAANVIIKASRRTVGTLALILFAFALGNTRGAYLGLGAGSLVLLGLIAWRTGAIRRVAAAGALIGALTIAGIGLYTITLPHPGVVADLLPSPAPGATPPSPAPGSSSAPGFDEYPDTLQYRLRRIPIALRDLGTSPLIGLGAASFGQRHEDPSRPGVADHIAILAVAALYEAGVFGALALAATFVLAGMVLLRALAVSPEARELAIGAAFAAALVTLLVAYQATNAIHFAINWLLLGAAIAWAVSQLSRRSPNPVRS